MRKNTITEKSMRGLQQRANLKNQEVKYLEDRRITEDLLKKTYIHKID